MKQEIINSDYEMRLALLPSHKGVILQSQMQEELDALLPSVFDVKIDLFRG